MAKRLQRHRRQEAGADAHALYWRVTGEARMLSTEELSERYEALRGRDTKPSALRALRDELCVRGVEPSA